MIEAEWFGGPHDGERLALDGAAYFPVETVLDPPSWCDEIAVSFHVKWVQPQLIDGRWLLVWKE